MSIADLTSRLARLVKTAPQRFSMGHPITEAAVAAYEARQRITLPEDYRAFVLAAGEGASGPDYGLLTLSGGIEERGETIYDLADDFPAPESTLDHLDFAVGGILPIQYSGCAYFTGLVTTGPCRGQVWHCIEDRPGWVPASNGPIRVKREDYASYYNELLAPQNAKYRMTFAAWYASWLDEAERPHGGGPS